MNRNTTTASKFLDKKLRLNNKIISERLKYYYIWLLNLKGIIMRKNFKWQLLFGCLIVFVAAACNKGSQDAASDTGWKYNDQEWGGMEKTDFKGQETGPNLTLITGGTFTMGATEEDVTFDWNNVPRRVTVSSFYMDETEVTNINYRGYLHWLNRIYPQYPNVHRQALPDTLVWREELAFNEPFVETYFRFPAYDDYPVVGVNWNQANEYCKWRTDRVNEFMLIEAGVLNPSPQQGAQDTAAVDTAGAGGVFTTDAYLSGNYEGSVNKNLPDPVGGGERRAKLSDGIVLPDYRLPTEAEWEYAAIALIGNQASPKDELITDRRIYPWDGNKMFYERRDKYQGYKLANFKKAKGDYMGMAGRLNDRAHITAPVRTGWPNDFGLFHMGGNVSEWTADVFRPMTGSTLSDAENQDLNPYRGNVFKNYKLDENGQKTLDSLGRFEREVEVDSLLQDRENYKKAYAKDFNDGDREDIIKYEYAKYTLINDEARVIKGGSWADRAYWLSPGTRRFKNENVGDKTIGFRCAMTRTGGPDGNEDAAGVSFGPNAKKRRY